MANKIPLMEPGYGERIEKARVDRLWSKVEFSRRVGVSKAAVQQWENEVNPPGMIKLREIAKKLGVSIRSLRFQEVELGHD